MNQHLHKLCPYNVTQAKNGVLGFPSRVARRVTLTRTFDKRLYVLSEAYQLTLGLLCTRTRKDTLGKNEFFGCKDCHDKESRNDILVTPALAPNMTTPCSAIVLKRSRHIPGKRSSYRLVHTRHRASLGQWFSEAERCSHTRSRLRD